MMLNPFPMEVMIEPKMPMDQRQLDLAVSKLVAEDASIGFARGEESGVIILQGADEYRLDEKLDVLRDVYKIGLNVGAPQIAYRETLARRIEIDETYKKLTDGKGQFARVKMIFEPGALGSGSSFDCQIRDNAVPVEFIPGVAKGIDSAMSFGTFAGFPVIDVRATLIDGAFHERDSSALAFEACARAAFRRGLKEGGSILLEPIMKLEVTAPEDYVGSIIGDLLSRRADVQSRHMSSNALVIKATVPMANMVGYANQLRSFSQGHATYTMQFDHYAPSSAPNGGGLPSG